MERRETVEDGKTKGNKGRMIERQKERKRRMAGNEGLKDKGRKEQNRRGGREGR